MLALLALAPACGKEFTPEGGGGGGGPLPLPPTEPFSLSAGDEEDQRARAVAVDAAGNIVVTGYFEGEIDLGGGPLPTASESYPDIFLAKLDPDGKHLWSKRFGSTSTDRGMAVAVDDEGNILLGASFASAMEFDGEPLQASGYDMLIAKFSPDGDPIWHRVFSDRGEDNGYDEPHALALDRQGNIFVAGRFSESLVLAETHQSNTDYDENRYDAFVAKLDPEGEPLWSLSFGGERDDLATDLATGPGGEVAVVGYFSGQTEVLGNSWLAPDTGSPVPNAFVLQLTADGQYGWGKSLGDDAYQYGYGVAIGDDGDTYVTGTFGGTIDFGGDERTSHGSYDVFLARYRANGSLRWSWHTGDGSEDWGRQVALAPDGTLALGGYFAGSLEFGTSVLEAEDEEDVFLARLDDEANATWSRGIGGTLADMLADMAVDRAGNTIVVGCFEGTLDFGQGELGRNAEDEDLFIAKVPPPSDTGDR